jgi:hypothetical protein
LRKFSKIENLTDGEQRQEGIMREWVGEAQVAG